jgi:hypothetical protein
MAKSPLRLPAYCTGKHPGGLDGANENPSPWDALAGDLLESGIRRPTSSRRGVATAWQQAASRAQTTVIAQSLGQDRASLGEENYETYEVCLLSPSSSGQFYSSKWVPGRLSSVHFSLDLTRSCLTSMCVFAKLAWLRLRGRDLGSSGLPRPLFTVLTLANHVLTTCPGSENQLGKPFPSSQRLG